MRRGAGAGAGGRSTSVVFCIIQMQCGIKCRSRLNEKFPLPVAADPWQMRNVSKQKALHTFRQQEKYKLNFLLKDKGKFCRAARVRESGWPKEREKARERRSERESESEPLSTFVILSKNENINSQRVISAATNAARRCQRRRCRRRSWQRGNGKPNESRGPLV